MTDLKIQSLEDLHADMRAVATGARPAPPDAAMPSAESADAVLRLLTPENRNLLRIIRDEKPGSIAELARLSARAEPNLLRTLAKLEAIGLVELRSDGKRRIPTAPVTQIRVEIDPFSMNDKLEVA
jgi:predicted transcriptional regulator